MAHLFDAIVVGAGPAGLAAAAWLTRIGASHVVLEREATVGASWRNHYDRLHLHTSKRTSELPFLSFPPKVGRYPSRDEVVAYLERYAEAHRIAPRFGEEVRSARHADGTWKVETLRETLSSRHLVVATGFNGDPVLPSWPGMGAFRGEVLHSSHYRNGEPWRGANVLVVGLGNSGGEIAIDLHEHGARPALSVRGPVSVIPREILGIPSATLAIVLSHLPTRIADALSLPLVRMTIGDPTRLGLAAPPEGPMGLIARRSRIPLLDVGTLALLRAGAIRLFPGIERFDEDGVTFVDGRRERFAAVVLATGYRPRLGFLSGAPGPGDPEAAKLALHYVGFEVVATGMFREIGREAKRVAERIALGEL